MKRKCRKNVVRSQKSKNTQNHNARLQKVVEKITSKSKSKREERRILFKEVLAHRHVFAAHAQPRGSATLVNKKGTLKKTNKNK